MIQIYSGLTNDVINNHSLSHDECIALIYIREKCQSSKTPSTTVTADGRNYYLMPQYSEWVREIGIFRNEKGDKITTATFEKSVWKLIAKGLISRRFIHPNGIKTSCLAIDPSWFVDEPKPNDQDIEEEYALQLQMLKTNIENVSSKKESLKLQLEKKKEKKLKVPTTIKTVDRDNILGDINKRKIQSDETFTSISNYPVSDECIEHYGLSILHVAVERYLREKALPMRGVDNAHGRRKLDNCIYYAYDYQGCRQYVEKGDCCENKFQFTEKIYNTILKDLMKKEFLFLLNVPTYLTDTEGTPIYEPLKYDDGEPVYPQKRAKEINTWIRFEKYEEYLRDEKYQEWHNYVKGEDESLFEDFFTGPIVMGARSDMIDFGSADNNKRISKKKYLKPKKVS